MIESVVTNEFLKRYIKLFTDYVLKHSTTSIEDLRAIDAEKENIIRAISYANELEDWEDIIKITQTIGRQPNSYLAHKALPSEALYFYQHAFKASKELKRKPEQGLFQFYLALILKSWGKREESYKYLKDSLKLFETLEDKNQDYTDLLHELGMIAFDRGELDESEEIHCQNLAAREKINYERGIAYTTHELGRISRVKGKFDRARDYYEKSLYIRKSFIDDPPSPAPTLHEMGLNELDQAIVIQKTENLESSLPYFEKSRGLFDESCQLKREYDMRIPLSNTLAEIGRLEYYLGRYEEALEFYKKSLAIKGSEDPLGNAYIFTLWAELELSIFEQTNSHKKIKQAQRHLEESEYLCNLSFDIRNNLKDDVGINGVNYVFAQIKWKKGEKENALELMNEVYEYWREKQYYTLTTLSKIKIDEMKTSKNEDTSESKITVKKSSDNFQNWSDRNYLSPSLKESVLKSDVLIVPDENFRDSEEPLFPQRTEEFFKFVLSKIPPEVKVEICIEDNDYKEFALYHDWITIAHTIVSQVVAPIFLGVLANYIYSKISNRNNNMIKLKLTVVESSNSKTISYEGSAQDFLFSVEEIKTLCLEENTSNLSKIISEHSPVEHQKPKKKLKKT